MFFTRVDFNIPQDKQDHNIVMNTARIDASLPKTPIKSPQDDDAKPVVFCSHLGQPNDEETKSSSLHSWLRLSRKSLTGPCNRRKRACSRSKTARANSAPGSIILLKSSYFYISEEDRGKDADSSKIKADPKKVKDG